MWVILAAWLCGGSLSCMCRFSPAKHLAEVIYVTRIKDAIFRTKNKGDVAKKGKKSSTAFFKNK